MLIHITEEDIKEGKRGDSCECPVARAVKRNIGGHKCSVYPNWRGTALLYVDVSASHSLTVPITQFVNRLMLAFDAGSEISPFEFELKVD